MKSTYIFSILVLVTVSLVSCTKDAIDQKTSSTIAVPSTIDDYQQLLDGLDGPAINYGPSFFSYRSLGNFLSDDAKVTDNNYQTFFQGTPFITGVLTWDKDMFSSLTTVAEWDKSYQDLLTINLCLEGLAGIDTTVANSSTWSLAEGMGLFLRGQIFYNLAQFWAQPYHPATAATDQGIVLRTVSSTSAPTTRSTVQASYDQILTDLKASIPLLPDNSSASTAQVKVRPSKAAAYAMLARVYLAIGDSTDLLNYADSALQLYSTLMDYNTVAGGFQLYNTETLYSSIDAEGTVGSFFGPWEIDSALVNQYDSNDLRKTLFFNNNSFVGGYAFVGDYSGYYSFTGIATDELYLMRAEANARLGNTSAAMADLNTLLTARYITGTYVPRTAANAGDALTQIITERRKELVFRGCRWTDLRRLGGDVRFAYTLTRTLLGQTYTLPPGDPRYTLQVPAYVITSSNGTIAQTP